MPGSLLTFQTPTALFAAQAQSDFGADRIKHVGKKKSRRASTVSESSVSPRSARSIGLLGAACSRASLNRCPGLLVWNYSSVQNELENVEELFFCESYRRRETYCTYACLQSLVSTPSDSARTSSPTFKPRLSAMSELQSGGFQLIVFVI